MREGGGGGGGEGGMRESGKGRWKIKKEREGLDRGSEERNKVGKHW